MTSGKCRVLNRVGGLKVLSSQLPLSCVWLEARLLVFERRLHRVPFYHDEQCCNICNCGHLNYWALQRVILSGRTTVTVTDTLSSPLDASLQTFHFYLFLWHIGKVVQRLLVINNFLTVEGADPERLTWWNACNLFCAVPALKFDTYCEDKFQSSHKDTWQMPVSFPLESFFIKLQYLCRAGKLSWCGTSREKTSWTCILLLHYPQLSGMKVEY